jgi:protease-4
MTKGAKRGLLIVGVVLALLVVAALAVRAGARPERGSVLELVLKDDIPEQVASNALAQVLGSRTLTMRDYVEALRRAREDERIGGLLLTVKRLPIGFARVQELRDAIIDFQSTGKWAVAYLETAGEFSAGNKDYYLATACGTIWLAPPGDVNLVGVRAEVPFVRGTLDKLGIVPDMDHIGAYKTAMNFYTEKTMTAAHRESMESIVGSLYGQFRRDIAAGRKMTEDEVGALVDRGPFIGPRALEAHLVDSLGYRDEMEAHLKTANGGKLPLVKVARYLKGGRYYDQGVKVALIYGVGGVSRGESDFDPVFGDSTMGSDTVAAAIKQAREDDSVKAIVFRVDSPGGSYVASDIIWREVTLTRGVKPIVVTMSDLAGSGGYFVAMAADRIIAHPGTITASIGVLAGKMVTTGFWSKIGLTSDAVQRGRHATFYSSEQMYTPEERAIFKQWLDRIYKDFVGKVAKGRNKTFDEVHAIAQGRIWSGEDAVGLGLVDEVGGLPLAIQRALELAKQDPKARVNLVVLPEPKSVMQEILSGGEDTRAAIASFRERAATLIDEGPVPLSAPVLAMPFVPEVQ